MPSSGSRTVSSRRWWQRRHWNSASISVTWISPASWVRHAVSRHFYSGWGAPAMASTPCPKAGSSPCLEMSCWSAPHCWMPCSVRSSMRSSWCVRPGTCWLNRSWPRSLPQNGVLTASTRCAGVPGPTVICPGNVSTRSSACWLTVIRRAVVDGTPIYTWMPSMVGCADGEARAWWR